MWGAAQGSLLVIIVLDVLAILFAATAFSAFHREDVVRVKASRLSA